MDFARDFREFHSPNIWSLQPCYRGYTFSRTCYSICARYWMRARCHDFRNIIFSTIKVSQCRAFSVSRLNVWISIKAMALEKYPKLSFRQRWHSHPLIQEAVLPSTYTTLTNQEADVFYAILLASLGAAIVIVLYCVNLRRAKPYV